MRKGILRDFIGIHTAGMGQLATEDTETHKVELVICELEPTIRALRTHFGRMATRDGYKDKVIYWECDEFGMLANFKPVKDS